jgi:hypothetical protein
MDTKYYNTVVYFSHVSDIINATKAYGGVDV